MRGLAENILYSPTTSYVMFKDVYVPDTLPEHVIVEGQEFTRKETHHVSLWKLDSVETVGDNKSRRDRLLSEIAYAATQLSVVSLGIEKPLYVCQNPEAENSSIIAPVDMLGLQNLLTHLRNATHVNLPKPYPHVTLYTAGNEQGVGIRTISERSERCHQVSVPEIERHLFE